MTILPGFFRERVGTTAAEFALVLPAALLLMLGTIDVGRYAWVLNEYEKATQMGARYAVTTNLVASGLNGETYVGNTACGTALKPGDRICSAALGTITCGSASCTCTGNCPTSNTRDATAFDAIVARMNVFAPYVPATAVQVLYRGSGIGFAGDPDKPEVAPFVTVRVSGAQYSPITLSPFGGTVPLPDFNYTLTLEDGKGAVAN